MSKFAPLHIISGYSFLQSGLTMKKIVTGIKNNDYFGAGLTDNDYLYGLPHFANSLIELNKPYILGINVVIDNNNLSFFAINEIGYQNLLRINTALRREELTFELIEENPIGLICVIETNHGEFKKRFLEKTEIDEEFTRYLAKLSKPFGDNFYLGNEVTSKEEVMYANAIRKFANKYTYKCVAFPRIRYLKKEDAISLILVQAINNEERNLKTKKAEGQEYFMSIESYSKIYNVEEIENTINILNASTFDINQKRGEILHFPTDDSPKQLKDLCFNSLKEKGLDTNETYVNQLNYELDVIISMGYADYFLLVQDYVNWAKEHDILVGPGRGSAAGALVSYLLNITEIDPIKYDLQFERFLNPSRKTMPDIDVDFMDTKRDAVVEYMREKYGSHNVANIVTFQTIAAKQSLRDIGRIFSYPEQHTKLLSKALTNPKYTLGMSYKFLPEFKNLVDSDEYFKEYVSLAGKIEGLPRQAGQHAAGVVFNNHAMEKSIPITIDFSDNYTSQYEAKYLEQQGFLKMDFLGLRNLTTVSLCVDLINMHNPGLNLSKTNIPYEEKEIFDLIREGQTMGLFQIDTTVMKHGIKILKPTCFEDVVALLALNRPGPMAFIKNYADRRDGKEKVTYASEELKKILSPTYGIIVYQEQINKIATAMAGFTPSEADTFRRAISKKEMSKMEALKQQFIDGSIKNGYKKEIAENEWNNILKFANYGFNRSHSVVYAVLACRMAWLKVHYPLEFYAALLQTGSSTNEDKFTDYLTEIKRRGLKILPPSINKSSKVFKVEDNALIFPLSSISGVNDLLCNAILEERSKGPFTDFFDFAVRMFAYKLTETQFIKLIDAGAMDEFYPSRSSMLSTVKSALQYAELNYSTDGQLTLGIAPIVAPAMAEEYDDPIDNLDREYEVLGIMLSSNPLEYKQDLIRSKNAISINSVKTFGYSTVCGIIKSRKVIKTKKGESMAYIKIYDSTGEMEITVFPKLFETTNSILDKNKIIVANVKCETTRNDVSYIAQNIELLED